jgi:hypothetical protein
LSGRGGLEGRLPAAGPSALSSFAAKDSLLLQLVSPGRLAAHGAPVVVVVGNSAGGQFVNRTPPSAARRRT